MGKMKVVAFLPVKGSSERIESKNTKLLDGKPLFLHTLEKLAKCDFIDEVYLDSESQMVFDLASEVKCHHLRRDPALATNKTDGHKLFYNEVKQVEADIYIQVLGTSPFIKPSTIRRGIDTLVNNPEYDSVVLVAKEKQYLWEDNHPVYDRNHIPNSKDLPDTIIESMGLYIVRKEVALRDKMRFGHNVCFLEASAVEKIDVNYLDEFELAGYVAAGLREKEREFFRNMKNVLSSSMLSDILDELNIEGVISDLHPNISDCKIFGRASTLKLRALDENEDYQGIYDALKSYQSIVPGDVIVVENECQDYAYFGNLNASLAVRAGALGAIIGGCTRDFAAVKSMGFPVFARGNNCKDVLKRATTESINKTIQISNITIHPGELIFADEDGIVVIPKKYETQVLKCALETIEKEKNVIKSIVDGMEAEKILEEVGAF